MTIGCTRCGATCEGDIIVAPLAFGFKHEPGCGHGVGPLAVIPSAKKSEKPKTETKNEPEPVKVKETVKEPQPEKSERKLFGKKE